MYFKVTNGIETRKFQVTPGQLTFEQLQERLATLFPGTYTTDTSNLVLRYRDSEGDVITLSSDEEFQEVLSDLPEDSVWKLHIASPRAQRQAKPTSFLHHTFEPTWSPFGIRRTLQSEVDRERQELLDLLFGFHDSTSAEKPPASAESEEQAGSKEATGAESVPPQEGTEDSKSSEANPRNGEEQEEEVKSKPSASHGKSEEEPSVLQVTAVMWRGLGCGNHSYLGDYLDQEDWPVDLWGTTSPGHQEAALLELLLVQLRNLILAILNSIIHVTTNI